MDYEPLLDAKTRVTDINPFEVDKLSLSAYERDLSCKPQVVRYQWGAIP
jgi:hypothetical protein